MTVSQGKKGNNNFQMPFLTRQFVLQYFKNYCASKSRFSRYLSADSYINHGNEKNGSFGYLLKFFENFYLSFSDENSNEKYPTNRFYLLDINIKSHLISSIKSKGPKACKDINNWEITENLAKYYHDSIDKMVETDGECSKYCVGFFDLSRSGSMVDRVYGNERKEPQKLRVGIQECDFSDGGSRTSTSMNHLKPVCELVLPDVCLK